MTNTGKIRLAPGVNCQSLGEGEHGVLLSMKSGYLFRFNHTAIAILQALHEQATAEQILAKFADHCGVPPETVHADVTRFLDQLASEKLIEKVA